MQLLSLKKKDKNSNLITECVKIGYDITAEVKTGMKGQCTKKYLENCRNKPISTYTYIPDTMPSHQQVVRQERGRN